MPGLVSSPGGGGDLPAVVLTSTTFNDDIALSFGTGGTADILFETADANANVLLCALPDGGATDVPVFVIGDKGAPSVVNADLGLFDGVTDPSVAVLDASNADYIRMYHDGTDGRLVVNAGNITIGTGTDSHVLNTPNDLFVSGQLEIDGTSWFDGVATFYDRVTFSGATYGGIRQSADDGLMIAPAATDGFSNNNVIITNWANQGTSHGHTTPSSDPTLFIHSNADPGVDSTQWISLSHNQTDGVIQTGKGNLTIGAGADSHSLTSNGDLFVSGQLEVDGNSWFDGAVTFGNYAQFTSDSTLRFGTSGNSTIDWSTAQATENTLVWGLGNTANSLILTQNQWKDKDHDHSAESNPTLFIHSATDPDINNTQWVSLTHDQTDGVITLGTGNLKLSGGGLVMPANQGIDLSAGSRVYGGGIQLGHQQLAANTNLTLLPKDGVVEVTTGAVSDNTITLPSASGNEGMIISVYLTTDGGMDAVVQRAGTDVIQNGSADLGNTSVTLDDVGDFVMLQAVSGGEWQIITNNGGVVA